MSTKKQQRSPTDMVNARTKNKALKDQLANLNRMAKSDSKQLADLTKEVEELRNAVKGLMKLSKREGKKPTKMELDMLIPERVREEVIDAAYAPTREEQTNNGNHRVHLSSERGARSRQTIRRSNNKPQTVAEKQLKSMLGMAAPKEQEKKKEVVADNDLAQSIREKLRRASTKEEVRAATNMARALGLTYEAGLGDRK
ncbi:hypothetical protein Pmar_PMAR019087, partial [Perkinsus marinus ATCC 50983]